MSNRAPSGELVFELPHAIEAHTPPLSKKNYDKDLHIIDQKREVEVIRVPEYPLSVCFKVMFDSTPGIYFDAIAQVSFALPYKKRVQVDDTSKQIRDFNYDDFDSMCVDGTLIKHAEVLSVQYLDDGGWKEAEGNLLDQAKRSFFRNGIFIKGRIPKSVSVSLETGLRQNSGSHDILLYIPSTRYSQANKDSSLLFEEDYAEEGVPNGVVQRVQSRIRKMLGVLSFRKSPEEKLAANEVSHLRDLLLTAMTLDGDQYRKLNGQQTKKLRLLFGQVVKAKLEAEKYLDTSTLEKLMPSIQKELDRLQEEVRTGNFL